MERIHFISIGGSVMHNLAIELKNRGNLISGSDDEIYEPSRTRLLEAGILPSEMGWFPDRLTSDTDAVILGMHARIDNPELARARELGIPVYSYPEYVFQQNRDNRRVVIAGSHGKTSITSMILHVLKQAGILFNYLVGAKIDGFETMVNLDLRAKLMVVEGDEYLTSPIDRRPKFLHYHPDIAVISGIAWDHFNVFPTWESYVHQFQLLLDVMQADGFVFYDESDSELSGLISNASRKDLHLLPYQAHAYRVQAGSTLLIRSDDKEVPVLVFGEHNMKNVEAAYRVCHELGISDEQFYSGIATFKGAAKRLELAGQNNSVAVFRDFAHAPSKVAATTKAVKEQFPDRKLVAVAELHTFSSLNKDFLGQYRHKMDDADVGVVFYDPHTLEQKRLPFVSPDDIRRDFGREDLNVFTTKDDLEAFLKQLRWENANLLLMSSGTFGGLQLESLIRDIV